MHPRHLSISVLTSLLLLALVASCGKDDPTTTQVAGSAVLSVTPDSRSVPATPAGAVLFTLKNTGDAILSWTASEQVGWATLSPAEGTLQAGETKALLVAYEANTGADDRSCTVVVSAEGAEGSPKSVTVDQAGVGTPTLVVSPNHQDVPAPAGTATISVSNSGQGSMVWSVSDDAAWLSVSPTSGTLGAGESRTLTASYDENTGGERSCLITVTAPDAEGSPKQVTVAQAPPDTPVLSVTPENRDVDSTSGSTTFTVKNAGSGTMNWSQSDNASWLTVSPPSGSLGAGQSASITASYSANSGCDQRVGTITVTASGAQGSPKSVTVTQAPGGSPVLSVTPVNRSVPSSSGSTTFTVKNDGCATMSWSQSDDASWLTVSPPSGSLGAGQSATLTASYDENTGAGRSCSITVTAPDAVGSPKVVTVEQAGSDMPVLSVTPENQIVGATSGSTTFTVQNEGSGTMNWSQSDNASWLTVSPSSGSLDAGQSATLTATYQANSGCNQRVGTITVTAAGAQGSPKRVTVTQAPGGSPVLSVTPNNRNVPSSSGSTTFTVKNDGCGTMSWTASDNASWLTVSPPSGSLNAGQSATLTASYGPSSGCDDRVGTITVTAPGSQGSPKSVTVTQASGGSPILSVTPSNRHVPSSSGSTTFTVKNDGCGTMNWSQSDNASWLTVSPPSGSLGAGQSTILTANYSMNSSCDERVGTITVTASGAQGSPKSVTVTQAAGGSPILSVTPNNRSVPSSSGSTTFTVKNDGCGTMNWSQSDNASWLTVSPPSGSLGAGQSTTLTANYQANTACDERVGTITVTAPGAQGTPKSATVTQAPGGGPILSVTPNNRNVSSSSGSTTFTVKNDGCGTMNWSQSDDASWLTVSPPSGSLGAGQSATITASYSANSGCDQRVGTITVTASGAQGNPKSVTVTQAPGGGPILSATPNNRDVPYTSGSTTFTVRNDGCGTMNWTATDNASWLSVSPSSGSLGAGQSATLTASYSANQANVQRIATITVQAPGATGSPKSVTVTQAPNPVETAYIEYRMNTSNTFTYTTNIPDSYLEDLVLRIDSDCSIVPRTVCCSSITYAIRCDPHSGWPTRDAEFWLEGLVIGPSTSSIEVDVLCAERALTYNPLLQIDRGGDENACNSLDWIGPPVCVTGYGEICGYQIDDTTPVIKIGSNPADGGGDNEGADMNYFKQMRYTFNGWTVQGGLRSSGVRGVEVVPSDE